MRIQISRFILFILVFFFNFLSAEAAQNIIDHTETNLVVLRRTIYLTIQSSLDFEECVHKLIKMELKPEYTASTLLIDTIHC